ncbi:cation diffusion facilitator family transporter [Desulfofalx alkaliphila]|uniref:cation diffusion facilitator family transporter n=1 Tax=Desulfofalx alkaliphila TaxID=105483 RepID=UPI000550337D|nr:cation diffusion facilitator family transporter [Desulfofalx alkaliphila]
MDSKAKVARLAMISNSFLLVGKLTAGIMMGSISVISDAMHSGLDVVASFIAFLSVRQSAKPADDLHRYGHGKYENLAAIVEALLIVCAALAILWHAIPRLIYGQGDVDALGLGMAVMMVSAAVNWYISSRLFKVAKETDSPALEADGWHLRTDVYSSVAVFIGIVLIKITGWHIIDPIVAICVTVLILRVAFGLLRDSLGSMLDTSLPAEDEEVIHKLLKGHERQYVSYHKLRTRKAGSHRHVDLHLVVPRCRTIQEAHQLCDAIESEIEKELPLSTVLIHSEPCRPPENCEGCKAKCQGKKNEETSCGE